MVTMPHLAELAWDYAERLRYTRKTNGDVQDTYFLYDASGQRVRKVYVHSGIVEERIYLGGYEVYRRSVGGTQELERGTLHVMDDQRRIAMVETTSGVSRWRYQVDNHLGSAGIELDETGAVISYEEYHPYGSTAFHAMRGTVEVSAKRYRYTGKEKDEETGLYYHGARYYAAWLGRWTSADPLGVTQPGRADLDLFAYVRGRPLSNVDRTGLDDDVPTPKKTRENGRASREHDKIPTVILTGSQTGTPMGREAGMAAGRAANAAAHRVSQMMRYLSWEGDFLKLRIPGADVQYARAEQLERAAIKTQEEERDEGRQFQPQSVVLHFTGDLQTQGTLRSWQTSATKGAHFLVSPEGVVYQTASLNRTVQHVRSYTWQGQRRARCATEGSCTGGTPQLRLGDQAEIDKPFPERYPFNWEAIGIELVHGPVRGKYPPITKVQFEATKALVRALQDAFGIDAAQILAHVDMDRKMPGEGIIPELTAGHRRPAALGKPVGVQP